MVDIDNNGGIQALMKILYEAGFLDGSVMTCTGQTLAQNLESVKLPDF